MRPQVRSTRLHHLMTVGELARALNVPREFVYRGKIN
jgi:hypothetical protein